MAAGIGEAGGGNGTYGVDDDDDVDVDDDGAIIVNRSQIRGAGAYSAFLLCRRSQKRKETVDRVQKDLEEKI